MQEEIKNLCEQLHSAILQLDIEGAGKLAEKILSEGGDANEVIDMVIKPTADEVGEKFQRGQFFLPQLTLSGKALEAGMAVLIKALPTGQAGTKSSVVIGTVKGDVHTIGKNVVSMMLRTGGFDVYDLGVDINTAAFIEEATSREVDIIAMSSLLTTTLPYQRDVIEELGSRGLRNKFKVIVGGGPCSQAWADEIGADGYGKDATEALATARALIGQGK